MTEQERFELKSDKAKWRKKMKKTYPDFCKRKWGNTSYRINHPQPL